MRLSKFFGTSIEFWINLQTHYEIEKNQERMNSILNNIQTYHFVNTLNRVGLQATNL
jgi:plasmid maintenance system antidote protein VapI